MELGVEGQDAIDLAAVKTQAVGCNVGRLLGNVPVNLGKDLMVEKPQQFIDL